MDCSFDQLNQLIPSRQRAALISVNSMFFSAGMSLLFPLAGALADRFCVIEKNIYNMT